MRLKSELQKGQATMTAGKTCSMYFLMLLLFCILLAFLLLSGVEPNPGPATESNNVHVVTSGSFHQGNMHDRKFLQHVTRNCQCEPLSYTAGVQCVANCILAIAFAQLKQISGWNRDDLDAILCCGDALYKTISPAVARYLNTDDIPTHVTLGNTQFTVSIEEDMASSIQMSMIKDVLQSSINNPAMDAVCMMGDHCGASACSVHYHNRKFYVFDSHSRSPEDGSVCAHGASVLTCFSDLMSCATFLCNLGTQL